MMKFTSMVMATALFAAEADARQKWIRAWCTVPEDLDEDAVQGGLWMWQKIRRNKSLKDIKIEGHYTNVESTEWGNASDNMHVSMFSDGECATPLEDAFDINVKDWVYTRDGWLNGQTGVKPQPNQTFGDDFDLRDWEGFSAGLFTYDDDFIVCCTIALRGQDAVEEEEDEETRRLSMKDLVM